MNLHIIHFFGPINTNAIQGLRDVALQAVAAGASEIRLHLSSEGGTLASAFTAYHFLRSLPIPITAHNFGNIESSALLLYLAAEDRLVAPQARFLLHSMHWGFGNQNVDHLRLTEHVNSLDFDAERYAKIFDERTKGAESHLNIRKQLKGNAKILNAESSLSAGISSSIVSTEGRCPKEATCWWVQISC